MLEPKPNPAAVAVTDQPVIAERAETDAGAVKIKLTEAAVAVAATVAALARQTMPRSRFPAARVGRG